MLKLRSSKGIRIDVPVLSVSWSVEDHYVIIQALRKGLIEHEARYWRSPSLEVLLSRSSGRGYISPHTRLGPEGVLILVQGAVSAKDRRGTVCCLGLMSSSHRVLMSEVNSDLSVKCNQTFAISTVQQLSLIHI